MTDEEKDNVFKISVPIITNEELERLDYTIESDLDNIVHQISETVSRDKDIIILKKVIEKQSKEIEELKNGQIDFWINDKEIEERIRNKFVSKDKIKAKIEVMNTNIVNAEKFDCDYIGQCRFAKYVLQSLLEKE